MILYIKLLFIAVPFGQQNTLHCRRLGHNALNYIRDVIPLYVLDTCAHNNTIQYLHAASPAILVCRRFHPVIAADADLTQTPDRLHARCIVFVFFFVVVAYEIFVSSTCYNVCR